ncbi:MAG: ATP-binding protein [Thalassovita sp.]
MANLIENGVRYGGTVRFPWRLPINPCVSGSNNGPGIPPESREQAIKPFNRLDGARNQNRGSGVGLGLAIATDIARAHGGVLRLGESEALGGLRADLVIGR